MAVVSLRDVRKSYAGTAVIHGVSCEIADGELIVVVGPSGCGKSTLLRMVAGLEDITSGEIAIGGRVVNAVEPKDRDIAMVFQNYALYPHMSVFDNMAYGLKIRGLAKSDIAERVRRAAGILQLETLLERKPRALSGGQRQRVAMGRAIVRDPAGLPLRRAALQSRCQAACPDAGRDQEAAAIARHHLDLRDPRSGRGDDARRPAHRDECRACRADRRAARALRAARRRNSSAASSARRR